MSDRSTLTATELNGGHTVRTRRLVTAQVSAEPSAQSAPRRESGTCGERKVTPGPYDTRRR
jgi:hypothetical protein